MRSSISRRKWRIRPWIGQAAASPSAQIVWPSTSLRDLVAAVSISRDLGVARRPCAPSPATSSRCLRGTACTGRSSRACRTCDSRAIALTMSVDLSMTMTAAVPRPDLHVAQAVEIHQHGVADRLRAAAAPTTPPGITASRLSQPPRTPPAWLLDQLASAGCPSPPRRCRACSRGRRCRRPSCRCCFGRPMPANQAAPRRRMVGATAIALDVVDRRRAAIEPDRRRERRLQPRQALLALEALEQRRSPRRRYRRRRRDAGRRRSPSPSRRRSCRSARPHRPRRSPPAGAAPRCRTRRGCRCRRRARPWRSRRSGSPRPACADRGAGCRDPCRCRARSRRR